MKIITSQMDANGITVRHIRNRFEIQIQADNGATSILMEPDEFHELVYQCLRAQEKEILELIKVTEKSLEEIGDVTKLWKQ
jgi:hypothetical protein